MQEESPNKIFLMKNPTRTRRKLFQALFCALSNRRRNLTRITERDL